MNAERGKRRDRAMKRYAVELHGWIQPDCGYHERPVLYAESEPDAIIRALHGVMPSAQVTSAKVTRA